MTLSARSIALQGFLLTPVAMAVQGLLAGEPTAPPEQPAPVQRVASGGRTRSTSMSLAEYQAMVQRLHGAPQVVLPPSVQEQATRRKMRQRKQHRIAALAFEALE